MAVFRRFRDSLRERGFGPTLRRAPEFAEDLVLGLYNRIRRSQTYTPPTDRHEFREIQRRADQLTSINDHLPRLFTESLQVDPDTIVELGVRGGESTFVFERVARLSGATLVSVDIDDCSNACDYDDWHFVQTDDVEFAGEFPDWCADHDADPSVDVLFIDTSHLYEHTVDEIEAWFPRLSQDAVVFFHDTNLTRLNRREDGTLNKGWNNDRGVIRALEDRFNESFDETERFETVVGDFVFRHYPYCGGLGVLRRLPPLE